MFTKKNIFCDAMKTLKLLLSYIFTALFILSCSSPTQRTKITSSGIPKNDLSYKDKWIYFTLSDTITANVIQHLPADFACGVLATASITICKTSEQDTIRLLNLCNMENYARNQRIKIIPRTKPPFGVTLPTQVNLETGELKLSYFDVNVLKTAWGEIHL